MTRIKNKIPVKRGSVTVWIYHTPGKTHDGWTVVHYGPEGTRQRIFRADFADAKMLAEKTASRLANIETSATTMSGADALDAAGARLILKPFNKSLTQLAQEYADARRQEAEKAAVTVVVPPFATVIEELITSRRADGLSDRHLDSLEDRLKKISKRFSGPLSALGAPVMDDLLRAMQKKFKWSGRTRNHYRAALSNLMSYGKLRHYLPRDWNEMEFVPRAQEDDGEIGVYSPDDLKKILARKPDADLLPFIVLGAFCGPRPSEIQRLNWRDVHFESGEVFVSKGKVRTAGHRIAPLTEPAKLWLADIKKKSGPVTTLVDYSHPLQDLLRSAEVTPVEDGLRHSFISYRQALLKDLPQVSAETGTSMGTLTRRYLRPMKREVAEAWFKIIPLSIL